MLNNYYNLNISQSLKKMFQKYKPHKELKRSSNINQLRTLKNYQNKLKNKFSKRKRLRNHLNKLKRQNHHPYTLKNHLKSLNNNMKSKNNQNLLNLMKQNTKVIYLYIFLTKKQQKSMQVITMNKIRKNIIEIYI